MQHSTARSIASWDTGPDELPGEFVARLEPANINPRSFLATDYLNHFNEAIMLLELVPDMPDMLVEAKDWQPKGYRAHFRDSDFAAKELACEAYELAPERFRIPFDLTQRALNRRIARAIEAAELTISRGETARLGEVMADCCAAIRELICIAGGIINGLDSHPVQAVDAERRGGETDLVMAQQEIDALFDDGEADSPEEAPVPSSPPETDPPPPACAPASGGGEAAQAVSSGDDEAPLVSGRYRCVVRLSLYPATIRRVTSKGSIRLP